MKLPRALTVVGLAMLLSAVASVGAGATPLPAGDAGAAVAGAASLVPGARSMVGGGIHTCVLTSVGGVKCWGYNGYGELGDGTHTDRSIPQDVPGLTSGVVAVFSAAGQSTCAVTTAGGVKCWGSNYYGELGDGTTNPRSTPVDVVGLGASVTAIAASYYHTCALTTAGGVKCWGQNAAGSWATAPPRTA